MSKIKVSIVIVPPKELPLIYQTTDTELQELIDVIQKQSGVYAD